MEKPEIKIEKYKLIDISIKDDNPYTIFKAVLKPENNDCNRKDFMEIFKDLGFYIENCIKRNGIFYVSFTYKEVKEYFDLLFKYHSTSQSPDHMEGISDNIFEKIKSSILNFSINYYYLFLISGVLK